MVAGLWWHTRQIADAFVFFWPVSLAVALLLIPTFVAGKAWQMHDFLKAAARLLLLLGVFFVLYLLLTLAFFREAATCPGQPVEPGGYVVSAAFLLHALIGLVLVVRSRYRLRLFMVLLATLWISLCSWFIAFLSTSGAASL